MIDKPVDDKAGKPNVSSEMVGASGATGVVAAKAAGDEAAEKQKLQAELESLRGSLEAQAKKYEADIDALRSSLQSGQSAKERDAQRKEMELKRQIQELKLGGMDESEKAVFLKQMREEEVNQLFTENQTLKQQMEEVEAKNVWYRYFVDECGLLPSELSTSTYGALMQSGMAALTKRLKQLPSSNVNPNISKEAAPVVEADKGKVKGEEIPAPKVSSFDGGAPLTQMSWGDLIKEYGSREAVYERVENGLLRPDIIPKPTRSE